jgi:hypothetical protein
MNIQAQHKAVDKLAITVDKLMKNATLAHINEGLRLQGIQMALMTTELNTQSQCYCQIADKLREFGIFDDTNDFKQRILSTIHNNTTNFKNGMHYILTGPPVSKKNDGSYNCIEAGNLLIPINKLHNFLLGGQFPLLNGVVQAYIACHHEIVVAKRSLLNATINSSSVTRRKRVESSIDPIEQGFIDAMNARLAIRNDTKRLAIEIRDFS